MKRGNTLLDNISKLNTFIHMTKSNEFLSIYLEKIINNRSKSIKFINDFDYISLDLLYTSLQIMNNKDKISKEEYEKIDKKELKYYLDKVKGISYFKRQVPQIKSDEILIDYIRKALANGEYICNYNSTIKFDNGLIVDSDWLVEFTDFLITSLNNNVNLSIDGYVYYFNTITLPKDKNNFRHFLKNTQLHEYNVSRKDGKKLTYQDIKYLIDVLSVIKDYDFEQLKDINSRLSKEKYSLSINKKNISLSKEDKTKLEKIYNEESDTNLLKEYLDDTFNCYNSKSNINKRKLIESYEMLRSLSHAYKCNYSLQECRKLFSLNDCREELLNALAIANFYINYIYDENNLHKYFNYALLKLKDLRPSIIDYETPEYKSIISNLSVLNKKVVTINRRINRYLENSKLHPKADIKYVEATSQGFSRSCSELERLVKEIKVLRLELEDAKDSNRRESNINKTKLKYIKEAIINGRYNYNQESKMLIFDDFSPKDYHRTFHLEITLDDFISIILSDYNRNIRINFYQI